MRRSLYSVGAGVVMSLVLAAPAAAAPVKPFTETTACDDGRVCMWGDWSGARRRVGLTWVVRVGSW
ncbi:hypothetical protein V6U90_33820, partial [Micromonospora sp. CPCC 206060]|uniref:hypothetical protein n=1 Tax=Micromonospora sp. CPCC 206060 TaxID=3122406 RepID=UPI002FEE9557